MLGHLSDIDLRLLRVFCSIADAGGFTQAQARLNISLSRLSVLVRDLELRLGYSLCRRGSSGFQLTEKGRELYDAATVLFADIERFRGHVTGLGGRDGETLHLGCVDGIAGPPGAMLPQAIRRFREQRPAVRICLHVQRPDELENAVLEERLQLAIGAFHHSLSGLRYLPLFEEQQNLYCSREHPFFSRQAREPALDEICTADYVGRGYMAEHQRPHGLVFNRSTTAYSMEAIATLVLSGTYIGYLPTHYAAGWVAEGRLRALRPGQLAYASGFHCASRQSAESCASLEDFVAILQAMYPQPGT